jgi:2-isopropylmalate synthase
MRKIEIFDTTLRDGAQQQGVNFSVADKLKIARMLKGFGIDLIEGGWPGAIPKDTEFFAESDVPLVAFGATCKPEVAPEDDRQVMALLNANTDTVCVVAKSDIRHVELALRTTPEENLRMVRDTVRLIVAQGKQAILDAEHYFDGFAYDCDYALRVVLEAFAAGARCVVLCDTNGGSLPHNVKETVTATWQYLAENGVTLSKDAAGEGDEGASATSLSQGTSRVGMDARPEYASRLRVGARNDGERGSEENGAPEGAPILGIHAHNDTGCAVANSLAAIEAGVAHVQGTVNEYGERTGNANILTVIANLQLKLGIQCVPDLTKAFNLAHNIAEIANINLNQRQPYVGDIAFAHKAGLHASALKVNHDLYQHIEPQLVGNDLKMIISEMAGRSSIELKAGELGFEIGGNAEVLTRLTNRVKALESAGYAFDSADASFELLLREELGIKPRFFKVESWRTISERQGQRGTEAVSEATVKLYADGRRVIVTGEGNGPVNALDAALRGAIEDVYPSIKSFELTDYRVRLLDTSHGTDSVTRVLITCYDRDSNQSWTTTGVGANIVESSWEALTDCYIYGLIRSGATARIETRAEALTQPSTEAGE